MKFPYLHPRGYYRLAVSAFYFTQGLVFASWASRIPDIKTALGLNDAHLGSVLFANPLGQLFAMGISGYLVGRFGSRKTLTAAAFLYPLTLIALGTISTVWQLTAALGCFGITANLYNIAVNTQGVGVERLYGRSIMATFHGLWSLAGFVGGLFSTWMVGADVSPLVNFCLIFGFSILVLLAMRGWMLPRDPKPGRKESPGRPRSFFKPDRYIVLLGVLAFVCMSCEGTMYDWSAVYFQSVIAPPKELIRLGYIACMGTMTLGRFLGDRIITRFGTITVIRISGILIASGLMTAVLLPFLIPATAGFLLVGFGISSIVPICYSLAGKSKTMRPGMALAAVSTIGFLGFLLGPPVIGFVSQALSLRWALAVVALVGLSATAIAPELRKIHERK